MGIKSGRGMMREISTEVQSMPFKPNTTRTFSEKGDFSK
jgi:hypothetical protein